MLRKMLALLLTLSLIFSVFPVGQGAFLDTCTSAAQWFQKGDITEDGKMNVADVSKLYAYVRKSSLPSEEDLNRLDVTFDGKVNIADVAQLYIWVKNGVDDDPLWSYAKRIQEVQSEATLTLTMMSDVHYCGHGQSAQTEKLNTADLMAQLSHYAKVDLSVNLGDMVAGNEEKDKTLEDLEQLMAHTRANSKAPVYFVRGNHDDNGWYSREEDGYPGDATPEEIIDHDQWHQLAFGSNANVVVTDSANPNGGYGYFDHEETKIRVFLLNTSDIPYILEEDGSYRYNAYECNAFSNAQLNFVANALLFADKDVPNEWGAMFLMHVPMDTTVSNGYRFGAANTPIRGYIQMLSIIGAYRKGITYTYTGSVNYTGTDPVTGELVELPDHFRVSVRADYSAKGCGDVICFVNGHTHIDNASQKVGLEYSLSYGYTYLSVVGADAFSTLVVDREKSVVSVFKYGEARSPMQSKDPQIVKNGKCLVVNGEKEFGINFSKSKKWVFPFTQFRPQGENLLGDQGTVALDGFTLPEETAGLYLEADTMLPSAYLEAEGYAVSKPILLKQNTQYEIPDIGESKIYTFHHSLLSCRGISSSMKLKGRYIITGGQNNGFYAVFVFDKESYPDYENFYIKENVHEDVPPNKIPIIENDREPEEDWDDPPAEPVEGNLFNGLSALWGSGYIMDTSAILDPTTLELSTAIKNEKYVISKALLVEGNTTYEIPGDVADSLVIYAYSSEGTFNGTCALSDGENGKIFKSRSSGGYVIFCFNRNVYSDFENFYVIKLEERLPENPSEPMEGNLFNGLSELWGSGYIMDTAAVLDPTTLELSTATKNEKYVISKALPVEESTTYEIPKAVANSLVIYAYTPAGTFNGTCAQSEGQNGKTFTSKSSGGYVIFCFNKNVYADFANFYVIKLEEPSSEEPAPEPIEGNLFNGMSELWPDGYLVNTSATLNVQTLELSTADVNKKYAITKAIAVKAGTEYEIPACENVVVYTYSADGIYNGTVALKDVEGCKVFTPTGSKAYIVFCFHKASYPNYRNFYIRERSA